MSRRRDDRRTLATTLAQSYWAQGSSSQTAVNAMLREARELGRALGDPDLEAEASSWLVPSYVVLCDHESARAQLAELLLLVQRSNEPFFLHVAEHYRAALALCDGDLDAAERGAIQSRDWGMLLTGRDASGPYGIQMFGIRREQGRLAELAPAVRLLDARTRDGAWRPGLAVVLAELGMADEARAALHHVLDDGLGALRSSLWIASLVYMADAAALLDDRDAAAVLYPELAAHVGENVMVGHLVACYGAMDRYLGMTATVLGDWERAEAHFQTALALNTRLGARTWLAHTAYWYARMLLARGRAEDADLLAVAPRARGRPGAGDRPADAPRARLASSAPRSRSPTSSPTASPPARSRSSSSSPAAARTARSAASSTSPSTPPRTTSARSSARRSRRTAPRPPATPCAAGSSPTEPRYHRPMPLYVIERRFAEQLELHGDDVRMIDAINADEGVSWLFSFISADKLRTYCLYEAPSPEAIVEAARRANVPADEIVEVSKFVPAELIGTPSS